MITTDVICCHLMSYMVILCHMMSTDVICYYLMSSDVTHCHPLSSDVTCCHIMSLLQVSNFLVNIYIYLYISGRSPRGVFTPKNCHVVNFFLDVKSCLVVKGCFVVKSCLFAIFHVWQLSTNLTNARDYPTMSFSHGITDL